MMGDIPSSPKESLMTKAVQPPENAKTTNRSNVPTPPSSPRLTNLTEFRDLFGWLWNQLLMATPQISVSIYVNEQNFDLFNAIHSRRWMHLPPIEWNVIFAEIDWAKPCDGTGQQCSVPMLQFVGQLSETVIREGGGRVSPLRACEMMIGFWDGKGEYIHYEQTWDGAYYLISTPACELDLGVVIRVKLEDEPMNMECWSLDGYAEWP